MLLRVLGSSSSGNGYCIYNDTEAIIIDAGIQFIEVKKALDFNISKIKCLLIDHAHGDHSKYVNQFLQAGITVMSGSETLESLGIINNPYSKVMIPEKGYKVGNFKIIGFPVSHDIPCLGFIICHPEIGKIAFLTDTCLNEYVIPDVTTWMIECNYADDILIANIENNRVHPAMRPRLMATHMALSTCLDVLKSNDLTNTVNIILIHMSSQNSDEARFVKEVRQATGKQVFAATTGLTINLNSNPY